MLFVNLAKQDPGGPGRKVKLEQEATSPKPAHAFSGPSVVDMTLNDLNINKTSEVKFVTPYQNDKV